MIGLRLEHIPPIRWWRRARWRLLDDHRVIGYAIPAGFISDGSSIPRGMTWLFSPTGKGMPAGILHDFLLTTMPRDMADRIFHRAMRACGVAAWRAWLMFAAVRLYGLCLAIKRQKKEK